MLATITKNRIVLFFFLSFNLYGNDTMKVDRSFTSPIANPVAIEFCENSFWIASLSQSKVYKLNSSMILIDSIDVGHKRISGIVYKDQKLWLSVDQPVNDITTTNGYVPYRIYGVSLISNIVTDSIFFKLESVHNDTGIVLGISTLNDTFCITLNMGWSSGIFSIIPEGAALRKSYLPLSGMALIGNELWGIRISSNGRNGRWITSIRRDDSLPLPIEVMGSDLAYDGTNIFVCIPEESTIAKLEAANLPVKNSRTLKEEFRQIKTYRAITIRNKGCSQIKHQYISLHGRKMNDGKKDNAIIGSQILIVINTCRKSKMRVQK